MSDSAVATLLRLVEMTPLPPTTDEPELLLAAFDAMVTARAGVLSQLESLTPPAIGPLSRSLADDLAQRDQAWLAALGLARQTVADRLIAVRRVQRRG